MFLTQEDTHALAVVTTAPSDDLQQYLPGVQGRPIFVQHYLEEVLGSDPRTFVWKVLNDNMLPISRVSCHHANLTEEILPESRAKQSLGDARIHTGGA